MTVAQHRTHDHVIMMLLCSCDTPLFLTSSIQGSVSFPDPQQDWMEGWEPDLPELGYWYKIHITMAT